MKNMLTYLKKYGNLSFNENPFNEIDALILSQISYMNIDLFSNDENQEVFVKDVLTEKNAKKLAYANMTRSGNEKFCKCFERTRRYDNVYFKHYCNKLDVLNAEQFFAVSFFVDNKIFISYRGTDLTIAGWREDANMAFQSVVPAQTDAVDYLNMIYDLYRAQIILGGHSKGGNLALYAFLFTSDDIRDNIINVYDFDGPGFVDESILLNQSYLDNIDKIKAYSSTVSMIAMLLHNVHNIQFLKTSGFNVLQHDPYNWHITGNNSLRRIKRNSAFSRYFHLVINKIFSESTDSQREKYMDIFFYIATDNPRSSLLDIKRHPFRYFRNIRKRRKLLSAENSEFFKDFNKFMFRCGREVFKDKFGRKRRIMKNEEQDSINS